MNWEDNLRQEINNAGCFTESEVNDLVMVFQDKIREFAHQFVTDNYNLESEYYVSVKDDINELLSERGIESI